MTKNQLIRFLTVFFFPPWCNSPQWGQGPLIIEASRSHSDTPHSVGLLWTSDQPDAETSTLQHSQEAAMPPVGFEPTVPASDRRPTLYGTYPHAVIRQAVIWQFPNYRPVFPIPRRSPEGRNPYAGYLFWELYVWAPACRPTSGNQLKEIVWVDRNGRSVRSVMGERGSLSFNEFQVHQSGIHVGIY
jgi:hypothetical protein